MNQAALQFGDKVRHLKKPEWGVGMVTKVENLSANGHIAQRATIRFPNEGVKTFNTDFAELQVVADAPPVEPASSLLDEQPSLDFWDRLAKSGWLEPLAQRKIQAVMTALPPGVSDPFLSLAKRFALTFALYRFDATGRSLIEWAVAQTSLADPMTRFTRHELETFFQRWAFARDAHLTRLLHEAREQSFPLADALKSAPAPAADAVRRLSAAMR